MQTQAAGMQAVDRLAFMRMLDHMAERMHGSGMLGGCQQQGQQQALDDAERAGGMTRQASVGLMKPCCIVEGKRHGPQAARAIRLTREACRATARYGNGAGHHGRFRQPAGHETR